MAIPNTTPTPNELFNGEMKKMTDTELRIVLIVTRATLGWEIDHKTGMRKLEDWISHSQLIEKSGKSSRAISYAIDSCVKKKWIETRDETGNLLKTAEERKFLGKKIFYRLGKIFLDKTITIVNNANPLEPSQMTTRTIANDDTKPSQPLRTTKETLTKETIQKGLAKPTGRNSIKFKKEDYNLVEDAYKKLKGIEPLGQEWLPIQQEIKSMFMSKRAPAEIIACMEWFAKVSKRDEVGYRWTKNWTIKTVRLKLPEFLVGNFNEESRIPDYAKPWKEPK